MTRGVCRQMLSQECLTLRTLETVAAVAHAAWSRWTGDRALSLCLASPSGEMRQLMSTDKVTYRVLK